MQYILDRWTNEFIHRLTTSLYYNICNLSVVCKLCYRNTKWQMWYSFIRLLCFSLILVIDHNVVFSMFQCHTQILCNKQVLFVANVCSLCWQLVMCFALEDLTMLQSVSGLSIPKHVEKKCCSVLYFSFPSHVPGQIW